MITALYRKSSGEVLKISLAGQPFDDANATLFGVLTDPSLPDGPAVRQITSDAVGPMRELGFAKIADPGTNTCRNATQPEIDTFAAAEAADDSALDRDRAQQLLETHPQFRKLMTAYSDILKDEFNLLRGWLRDFQGMVDSATSLADLKAQVATLPALPDRDLSQLRTAIRNRLSAND